MAPQVDGHDIITKLTSAETLRRNDVQIVHKKDMSFT